MRRIPARGVRSRSRLLQRVFTVLLLALVACVPGCRRVDPAPPSDETASEVHPGTSCAAALLLLDVQRLYVETTPFLTLDGAELVERVHGLVVRARAAGVPIVHIHHLDPSVPSGSELLASPAEIAPLAEEPVVRKQVASAFAGTDLVAQLEARGVRTVVIAGLPSPFCVDATVSDAIALGYRTIVVSDAHSYGAETADLPRHNLTWRLRGAEVARSATLEFARLCAEPTGPVQPPEGRVQLAQAVRPRRLCTRFAKITS